MEIQKSTRKPVQKRSIETKEKILKAALNLFCEKGYYKTTTNEIAQRAHVCIGSLYSYFEDKDTIFFEILDRYHDKFDQENDNVIHNEELLKADQQTWLNTLFQNLIRVHRQSKDLNRELTVLSYYNPKIKVMIEKNIEKTRRATIDYFLKMKFGKTGKDLKTSSIVIYDLISTIVDRIVFQENEISEEDLIKTAIDMIMAYLT